MSNDPSPVSAHYDAVAERYRAHYDRERLEDPSADYPANYFRLQLLLDSFTSQGINRVIEVGVGEGTPLVSLGRAGMDVWGFDISPRMVAQAKATLAGAGMDPDRVFLGDIRCPQTYAHVLGDKQFDGLMAMGVMPHVEDDRVALDNMAALVRPGGSVFVEFRNKLFSLFTFNRYTLDFILNDLLAGVADEVKEHVAQDLQGRLRMDMPPVRKTVDGCESPGYDAILSRFHNPFEVLDLFKQSRFENVRLLWYHYHPAMPYLGETMPELFRKEAIALEREPSGWRGYFLCSAFVVEATKAEGSES